MTWDAMLEHEAQQQPLFDLAEFALEIDPTKAMRSGEQHVDQCAWCGAVVVWGISSLRRALGACPACGRDGGGQISEQSVWWRQALPVAGLRRRT